MSNPWISPFLDLRQRLDELFEERIYRRWAIPGPMSWNPPLDLFETREAYLVVIDVPGVPPDRLEVRVTEETLIIAGERPETRPEGAVLSHRERRSGPFRRSLTLACTIDPEAAWAESRLGIVHIGLPKQRQSERLAPETISKESSKFRLVHITIQ